MITVNDFENFTYSKWEHIKQFTKFGNFINFDPDNCDLIPYQNLFCYNFITENLYPGAKILQLGGGYSPVLEELKKDYECWHLDAFDNLGKDPKIIAKSCGYHMVVDQIGNFSSEVPDNYFDCVFSISVLTKLPENQETFQQVCQDINRLLKFGGLSLHLFDILIKKDSIWTNEIVSYIFENIKTLQHSKTLFSQIASDLDLYTMSQAAYEKLWQSATQKNYEQFGKPGSCNILWRRNIVETNSSDLPDINQSDEYATDYLKKGYKLQKIQKIDEAVLAYKKAIELNPKFSWAYHELGESLMKKGLIDEAILAYQETIKINPKSSWSYYNLAEIFKKLDRFDEAIEKYHQAIYFNPEYYKFYQNLAECLSQTGKTLEALSAYQKANQLNSDFKIPRQFCNLITQTKHEGQPLNWKIKPKSNLIYDIGMHIGQDTEFYLKKGFKVVAIEANPILAKQGEEKFKDYIDSDQLTILNIGIDDKEGSFPFYVNESLSEWSSFVEEIGARGGKYHTIMVQCLPLDKILLDLGIPYYIKVDIEGHDFKCIEALRKIKNRPNFISVENGNGGLLDLLHELGYKHFKFINQAKVPETKCPNPPREGEFVNYQFTSGCSGLFGEETIGRWKNYNEVSVEINNYWNNPNRDDNVDGWFDLHAKLEQDTENKN